MAQEELKTFEEQNEQHKQEIQQLGQSLDEQRSLLAEFESKFRVNLSSHQSLVVFEPPLRVSGVSKSMHRIGK